MTMESSAIRPKASARSSFADSALRASTRFWFFVAAAGQMMFVYYLVFFYGRAAVRGNWGAWNRIMPHAYVPGDTKGNFAIAAHIFLAIFITAGGAVQLLPPVRKRLPALHRWIGRIYIPTVIITSLVGLYMVWFRGGTGDVTQHLGITLNALLITVCAVMALRTALARRFDAHRRWALRLFMVANGVWFFRVGLMLWLFLNQGPAGFDMKTFTGPFLSVWSFADSLLPLAILEIYLRTKDRAGSPGRLAMATGLVVLTLGMGVGVLMATLGMWLPYVNNRAGGVF